MVLAICDGCAAGGMQAYTASLAGQWSDYSHTSLGALVSEEVDAGGTPWMAWQATGVVDTCHDAHGHDWAARLAMRQSQSAPLVSKIKAWLDSDPGPPGTNLAKAVNYLLGQWAKLTVFLDRVWAPQSGTTK